jgi:hypothetical protein
MIWCGLLRPVRRRPFASPVRRACSVPGVAMRANVIFTGQYPRQCPTGSRSAIQGVAGRTVGPADSKKYCLARPMPPTSVDRQFCRSPRLIDSCLLKVPKRSGNLTKRRCSPFPPMPYLLRTLSAGPDVSANTTGAAPATAFTLDKGAAMRSNGESQQDRQRCGRRVGLAAVAATTAARSRSTPA